MLNSTISTTFLTKFDHSNHNHSNRNHSNPSQLYTPVKYFLPKLISLFWPILFRNYYSDTIEEFFSEVIFPHRNTIRWVKRVYYHMYFYYFYIHSNVILVQIIENICHFLMWHFSKWCHSDSKLFYHLFFVPKCIIAIWVCLLKFVNNEAETVNNSDAFLRLTLSKL